MSKRSPYPIASLGDVLRHRKEFIQIDDSTTYKRCRVQLHARGVVLRDEVPGIEIKTKNQQVCRSGEFLVAEIDAKHGGFGIVPPDLDGAIVSSHYFLFDIAYDLLALRFLDYYVRTPAFQEQVVAKGSTNHAAVRPAQLLEYTIPLPPLDEQLRVVDRIEALAEKVEEVRALRTGVREELREVARALLRPDHTWNPDYTPMAELVVQVEPDVRVVPEELYAFAGVYSFGRGVFSSKTAKGFDFSYPLLTTVRAGNFIYPKLMAWEGAFGVVPPECDGLVVSPEFPVFRVNEERVLPEVLDVYFRTPAIWPMIAELSTGTNARRRRLHPSAFLRYSFPLPPMPVQQKVREIVQKAAGVESVSNAVAQDVNDLMPAILDRAFKGEL